MEYKIVVEPLLADLEADVNAAIAEGWAPCGGVGTARYEGGYFQAMVRQRRSPIVGAKIQP
jgi:hypothetical protein